MAIRRQLNNVIFYGYRAQVLENRTRISYVTYAYSVFEEYAYLRILTYSISAQAYS